jgi:nitrogen fixation-related uncharacterized protein
MPEETKEQLLAVGLVVIAIIVICLFLWAIQTPAAPQ